MREYTRDGKMVIHSTDLWNFLICPKRFLLGRTEHMQPTSSMRDGLIFEALVFGEKEKGDIEFYKGRKNIENFVSGAERVKQYFGEGKPFQRIECEYKDVILSGEVDFYGEDTLYDLKFTKNLDLWRAKKTKIDFLQAIYYTFIDFHNLGEIKDFYYIVTDSYTVLKIKVNVKQEDFEWLKDKIDLVRSEVFFSGNTDNCDLYYPCGYKDICQEYTDYYGNIELNFEELV